MTNSAIIDVAETSAPANQDQSVNAILQRLSTNKSTWASVPFTIRIALLKQIRSRILDKAVPWAKAATSIQCKGEDAIPGNLVANVFIITSLLDSLIDSLSTFNSTGSFPKVQTRVTPTIGHTIARVFPRKYSDRLSLLGASGVQVDMYIKPNHPPTQGQFYTATSPHQGKLAVCLGAGNQNFLAIADVLHEVFNLGCVVALKPHPLQAPTTPYVQYILQPLIDAGYCAILPLPDVESTKQLLYNPLVDKVHMTGGNATHDAIVWGSGGDGEEVERRKRENDPLLKVPITSELGCVTPWLVVPGPWSDEDISHQAQCIAEAVAQNVSCNCLAAKVVLLPDGWDKADALMNKVTDIFEEYPLQPAYYPGIHSRYNAFMEKYPNAVQLGGGKKKESSTTSVATCPNEPGEPLPWLVNVLDSWPTDPTSEYALNTEPFAPVLTFVKVPSTSIQGENTAANNEYNETALVNAYLASAVRIANENLWGNLSCTILVHPKTEEQHGIAVQRALDTLKYGSVNVNLWSAAGYLVPDGHWGGWQGEGINLQNVQSGLGEVKNGLMFDHTEKCVVRGKFGKNGMQPIPAHLNGGSQMGLRTAYAVATMVHSGVFAMVKSLITRPSLE